MNELAEKTERLVQMMNTENLDGVMINTQHNFAWLTGGGKNGVDLSVENGVGSLLISSQGNRYILANQIEMPRFLKEEVSYHDFEPIEFAWEQEKKQGFWAAKVANREVGHRIVFDRLWHSALGSEEGLIAKCRYQLTSYEIERFQHLGRDAGEVLGNIYEKIEVGQTEQAIANIVRFELGKRNINSVVTLVAADERIKQFRHPIPTENVWQKTLMIVVCAKRDGLIASLSRIFSVGNIAADLRKRTDAVAKVHAQMIHATRPNQTAKDIFEITKKAYSDVGFANEETNHHQGGACGYKTRDWVAHSNSTEQVQLNQAFAWNPSITGTKSEETFIVKEDGIEIVTASPNFPTISNFIDGIEYKTPDIFCL